MAFVPRFTAANDFSPLFQFINDYSDHATSRLQHNATSNTVQRQITPRFDVRELDDGYELQGELPGVDNKDVSVEFTDDNSLTINGRIERAVTKTNEDHKENDSKSKQAVVEDAPEDDGQQGAHVASTESTEVSKTDPTHHRKHKKHEWIVTERHFGTFSRTFQFAAPVDRDAVTANLKNGILIVAVPKRKIIPSKKITIAVE